MYSLPWEQFRQRTHELPPRKTALAFFGSDLHEVREAGAHAEKQGYLLVWLLVETKETWAVVSRLGLLVQGCEKSRILWQVSPCLAHVISAVEQALTNTVSPWRAVDIACGCGREAVWLAMRSSWKVLAIDYLEKQLNRAKGLAEVHGAKAIEFKALDVEKESDALLTQAQEVGGYHLVNISRYLHRPLFSTLKEVVSPGGFIVLHTFMVGCEKFGRPRQPQFLLNPGELAQEFSNWKIIIDEVHPISDGRPTSFFAAQKLTITP